MATLSSILAWRIPWTEEPSRLQSMRLQELDTTERLSTPSIVQLSKVWARTNSCSWSQILSAQLSWPVTNDNNEGRSPSGLLQNGNNRNWTWQSLPWSLWLQILPASQRRQWHPTPVHCPCLWLSLCLPLYLCPWESGVRLREEALEPSPPWFCLLQSLTQASKPGPWFLPCGWLLRTPLEWLVKFFFFFF